MKLKAIFLALSTFMFATVQANNYYFSANLGDDSRSASEAQNPHTPWRTISKLNSFFSSLAPGDAVLFNRGETFYGSIEINKSRELYGNGVSSSTSPITIGAFGSGAKPIITGLQSITNWIPLGGGIYETTLSQNDVNIVTFQGNLQPVGRWPKISAPNAGYLPYQSHHGTSSITSNAIGSASNFSNGEVVILKWGWILDRGIITHQTSTTVGYTTLTSPDHSSAHYEPQDGHGFFFQNHINTLTEVGDWMYDKQNKKVRMFFGSNNPSSYNIGVATVEKLVNIKSSTYLTFDNLSLIGANSNAISMDYAYNIHITNCNIDYSGIDGITTAIMGNSNNITVKNCTISNTNNNAINANGTENWTIQNNIIRNTGIIRGMGLSGDGTYNALAVPGSNSLIEYNEIKNTGYMAIEFKGENVIVKNNFIDGFSTIKSDGGGIYNFGDRGRKGRKVIGNIVVNGIGDVNGRDEAARNSPFSGNAHGIYMDGGAWDVEIRDNTVANCSSSGLELSSSVNMQVINNTFFNNTFRQIYYREAFGPISNLTLTGNILFSTKRNQLISYIDGSSNTAPGWGTIDYNYYCRPLSEPSGIETIGYSKPNLDDYTDGGIIQPYNGRFYSLDKWQAFSQQDNHTKKTPIPISDLNNIVFEYNSSNSSRTIPLNASYIDVKGNSYNNSVTLAPYSSIILLKSGAASSLLNQTISFGSLSNKTYGGPAFNLNATASSGLPVSYRIVSGPATISGNNVTVTGTGAVIIEASQAGNATYNPATNVTQSFDIVSNQSCNPTFLNNGSIVLDATCGNTDGNVSIIPISGVAPYMFSKDGGATYVAGPNGGYTFDNLPAGIYRLRLKDVNGCQSEIVEKIIKSLNCGSASGSASVSTTCNPPTFLNNGSIVRDATCGNSDGIVSIIPTSGVAPFMYSKDGGATYVAASDGGYTFDNLLPGTYRLRLKDANNCESEVVERAVRSVNCGAITTCTPPTFLNNGSIVRDASFCGSNDGFISIMPTSGEAPLMYSKDGGATYVAGPNGGYTFNNLTTGTYRLRLKNSSGCESEVIERSVRVINGSLCDGMASMSAVSELPLVFETQLIKTYPNPSKGQFKLQLLNSFTGKVEISILDGKGAVIKKSQYNLTGSNNTLDFNLSGQAAGLYYVKVTSKKGTEISKVIIQ
jgi:parallel beta-helix repeat protein